MYLKSLTLKGFKSFADTTALHLEPGVSVVVGPNGSGKSNVVDAVAWVLGAQGPRTVRSSKMDDVIFAGTADRAALGRAEVSLTIDNGSGMLPIEFSEVTISRTLFRSGTSEYAINAVPCRLLDVQELLSDSGVGRTQHVIVGQGQLDAVLEARPEERRAVIEEAAGVLKFRRRKEKAERRLESTEGNLVRLSDLVREVRRQLRPLERQAEAAQRHGALVEELHGLRLHLAGRELAGLQARQAAAAEGSGRLAEDDASARAELRRLDDAVEQARVELTAAGADDLAEPLARIERLAAQARGLLAVLTERRRSVEREADAALDRTVVATLEAEAAGLHADLEAVEDEVRALRPDLERVAGAEAALAAEREALSRRRPELSGDPGDAAARARSALAAVRTAAERGEAECARAEVRLTSLQERKARLASEHDELEGRRRRAEEEHERLDVDVRSAAAAVIGAETALTEAEAALRSADAERHTWTARAEALAAALDTARARAGAERLAGVEGALGALQELVEVDPGWEVAFEAAAGQALAAVVVDGDHSARRALDVLRQEGTGAVLALGLERRPPAPAPGGEAVRAHVRSRHPGVAALLDVLVGGATCVGGDGPSAWEAAVDAALHHPDAVVVTRAGDRFGPEGWRVGGAATGATSAARDEARQRASAGEEAVQQAEQRLGAVRSWRDEARRAEAEAASALRDNAAVLATTDDAAARVRREAEAATAEVEELRGQLAALREAAAGERRHLAQLEAALPALEAEEDRAAAHRRELDAERHRLEERAAAAAALRSDVEVRATGLADRRSWLQRRLSEVEDRLSGMRDRRARAEAERVELDRRRTALERLAALVGDRLTVLEATLAELRERRRRQSEQTRALGQRLDHLRAERVAGERRLEELRERGLRAGMEAQELALRIEAATEALRRDLDAEPAEALAAPCPPLPEGTPPAARARALERELRLMGPVNPLALEEASSLRERQAFLEDQLDDVKSSRRELAKVIRAVDAEIVDVFVSAFADVAENFTRLFATLFPGGEGRLELTDPGNPLETGIRVRARPSGKNVRSISLLSGGERSLTALAYLFAVFRSRPSPFYILDEVEAALDDVNLHRFLDLIQEFRKEAQLLIVSHQQRTMGIADVLYGVTMAPGGASAVVSERLGAAAG